MTRDELETQMKAAHVAAILIHGNEKPFTIQMSPQMYQAYTRMLNEEVPLGGCIENELVMWKGIPVAPSLEDEASIEFVLREIDYNAAMRSVLKDVYLPAVKKSLNESSILWKRVSKESHE